MKGRESKVVDEIVEIKVIDGRVKKEVHELQKNYHCRKLSEKVVKVEVVDVKIL